MVVDWTVEKRSACDVQYDAEIKISKKIHCKKWIKVAYGIRIKRIKC